MNKLFLLSVQDAIAEKPGLSAKSIAEYTGWELPDIKKAILILIAEKRIERKGKAKGTKYFSLLEYKKPQAALLPEEVSVKDANKTFSSIEDFLKESISLLPSQNQYSATEISLELNKIFPSAGFKAYEIISKLAWCLKHQLLDFVIENKEKSRVLFSKKG